MNKLIYTLFCGKDCVDYVYVAITSDQLELHPHNVT